MLIFGIAGGIVAFIAMILFLADYTSARGLERMGGSLGDISRSWALARGSLRVAGVSVVVAAVFVILAIVLK